MSQPPQVDLFDPDFVANPYPVYAELRSNAPVHRGARGCLGGRRAGEPVDWDGLLADYGATVDWSGCTFYKELMQAYPDAKVLLSVRDPERWHESARNTIYGIRRGGLLSPMAP